MPDLELDPHEWRARPEKTGLHQRWFWGALATAVVVLFSVSYVSEIGAGLLFGLATFVAGVNYARWAGHEGFFAVEGREKIAAFVILMVLMVVIGLLGVPIRTFVANADCALTGYCQAPQPKG